MPTFWTFNPDTCVYLEFALLVQLHGRSAGNSGACGQEKNQLTVFSRDWQGYTGLAFQIYFTPHESMRSQAKGCEMREGSLSGLSDFKASRIT